MRSVSATEAKQNLAAVLDAAQREPVLIRRHNRDIAVVVSPEDYERIRRANVAEYHDVVTRVGEYAAAQGMNEEVLERLLADESPAAAGH